METKDQIEKKLLSVGVNYYYIDKIDLSEIDKSLSLENQARVSNVINKDTLSIYSSSLANGDVFPPVVCWYNEKTKKFIMVDGNHRVEGARSIGWEEWPFGVYVVKNISDMQYRILIYEANLTHGLPASIEDRLYHATYLVQYTGMTQIEAAKKMKVSQSKLSASILIEAAKNRIDSIKLNKGKSLVQTGLISLNSIPDDDVFRKAVEYSVDMKLDGKDMDSLSKSVRAIPSSRKQIEYINEQIEKSSAIKRATAGADNKSKYLLKKITNCTKSIKSISIDDVNCVPKDIYSNFISEIDNCLNSLNSLRNNFK